MTLPLPYTLGDEENEGVQANFDHIKKQFPLGRENMKIERPHVVGDVGEPAFQNGWLNYDTTAWRGARFWKDPMGLVHVEGLVKSGASAAIFTLPAGYRPTLGLLFTTDTNTGHGRVDVAPTGEVVSQSGGNGYFSINLSFKQEQ